MIGSPENVSSIVSTRGASVVPSGNGFSVNHYGQVAPPIGRPFVRCVICKEIERRRTDIFERKVNVAAVHRFAAAISFGRRSSAMDVYH